MFRLCLGLILLLCPSLSYAQASSHKGEVVAEMAKIAREKLTSSMVLPDGTPLPAESDYEKERPVIPMMDAVRVFDRGTLSAVAEWCKLEWKDASYGAFMQQERTEKRWAPKQMMFIGLLHDVTMETARRALAKQGSCSKSQTYQVLERLKPKKKR